MICSSPYNYERLFTASNFNMLTCVIEPKRVNKSVLVFRFTSERKLGLPNYLMYKIISVVG